MKKMKVVGINIIRTWTYVACAGIVAAGCVGIYDFLLYLFGCVNKSFGGSLIFLFTVGLWAATVGVVVYHEVGKEG